ncbi:hypothetical protein J6590_033803 [Homalodisca vitripennis]|nr:hypothetical protein J6590_033803 [Homalodisca vitripennis]
MMICEAFVRAAPILLLPLTRCVVVVCFHIINLFSLEMLLPIEEEATWVKMGDFTPFSRHSWKLTLITAPRLPATGIFQLIGYYYLTNSGFGHIGNLVLCKHVDYKLDYQLSM